jgi:CheY-like chemotaxis protein
VRESTFAIAAICDLQKAGFDVFSSLPRLDQGRRNYRLDDLAPGASKRNASLPVIMLSVRAGEEARIEGLGAGADYYPTKPFSARELVAQVNLTAS